MNQKHLPIRRVRAGLSLILLILILFGTAPHTPIAHPATPGNKTLACDSFVTRHSSFVTRHSPFVTRHSSFVTRHSSFVIRQAGLRLHHFSLPRMGTLFKISLYHVDANEAQKSALAAFDRVEELEDIFSDYRERSEVMRLCRVAVGTPWAISPELFKVLESSLRISRLSGGAFDVTAGPEILLWREARRNKRLPDANLLKKARQAVGYANIVLDANAHTALLKLPDMRIDLGGIAKGYAADQALALLKSRGIQSALVDGGGDIAVGGAPPGKQGWNIAVVDPDPNRKTMPRQLSLHDIGIATSGDAYQFIEIEGRRYSHIIHPGSGIGVSDSASVTVIAPDGITADALATALSVMPVQDGLRMIESMPGVSAAIIRRGPEGLHPFYSTRFPKQ